MTRMWLVDPRGMCDQHLLGEHMEMHQEVGQIRGGNTAPVKGHARKGQVDTSKLGERHDELVEEMERRGFDHRSPLDYEDELGLGEVDREKNRAELRERCERCARRMA